MSYQIIGGNIVSKDTSGINRQFIKLNVDTLIAECKRQGITNKYLIAGILATVSKESGFIPQNENLNYSADSLKKTFPSSFGPGKENPNSYAKKPEKIANFVYGGKNGNTNPGDGFKYRGRGLNQITFKSSYNKYGSNIPNILSNPDQLNQISQASIAAVAFYVDGFKNKKQIKDKFGKSSANDFSDWDDALLLIINLTAGIGNSVNSRVVKYNYDKAKKCHQFLIDYLEGVPEGAQKKEPIEQPVPTSQDVDNQPEYSEDVKTPTSKPISNLVQFFKPSISPIEIAFDIDDKRSTKNDKEKISKQAGYIPFIWYSGVQISYNDIKKFNLYHKGIIPAIEITFFDSWGILREDGFPSDDAIISIYLNSRSLNLRSIQMDFKILDFKDSGEGIYNIIGVCNIPQIFLGKYISYSGKTSHETLQQISKEIGIGFCSNIQNSQDKMTWINTGFQILEFIENIISNSYVSDTSFQYCYIDFFYNLCYVDLNKEMERDVSNDKMITGFGFKFLTGKEENNDIDEEVTSLLLMNDKSVKDSISFFSTFEITNKSTKVSIDKSYRIRSKFYDTIKKELLVFDVESQTTDGSKSIILKGSINDDKYFKDNTANIWIGKQDFYDNGDGNVHENYNYAIPQNRQNLDDITKISCRLTLPNVNYNLYIYQKIPIYFTPQKETPGIQNSVYKRLSGDWLITAIEFVYDGGGKYSQIITAVKRELSLLPNETTKGKSDSTNKNDNNNEKNINEIAPNDVSISSNSIDPIPATFSTPSNSTISQTAVKKEPLDPSATTFTINNYQNLTLQGVIDLAYKKLNIIDPNAQTNLWDDFNKLKKDEFDYSTKFPNPTWESAAPYREKIINKATEIVNMVDV